MPRGLRLLISHISFFCKNRGTDGRGLLLLLLLDGDRACECGGKVCEQILL